MVLEKEMATHSGILAWEIPPTEEPGGLQPMGSQSRTRLTKETTTKNSRSLVITSGPFHVTDEKIEAQKSSLTRVFPSLSIHSLPYS